MVVAAGVLAIISVEGESGGVEGMVSLWLICSSMSMHS